MRRTGSVWRCDSAELLREKFLPQKGLQTMTHDTATICGSLWPQVRAKLITSTNTDLWRGNVIKFFCGLANNYHI